MRIIDADRLTKMLPWSVNYGTDEFMKGYNAAIEVCKHLVEVAPEVVYDFDKAACELSDNESMHYIPPNEKY